MSSKNQVTLTFAGDSDKLERSMARVGASSRKMKKDVDDSGSALDRLTGGLSSLGDKISGKLPGAIGSALSAAPPQVQAAALAAGGVIGGVMAGAAGAALVSGILLAVGGGVLAAGIVAAAKSPVVKAAWGRFGEQAKSAFANFGKPFEGPVARAAATFSATLQRMAPAINGLGVTMAPIIDKLAPALASMAEKALPGIVMAAEASAPLFAKLAEHAPRIGQAVSDFFEVVASRGPQVVGFFDGLLRFVAWLIRDLGTTIAVMADLWSLSVQTWNGISHAVSTTGRTVSNVASGIAGAFRTAFNFIADAWNSTVGRLSWSVPGWIPGIGGAHVSAPRIPRFHTGGVVPGAPGSEMLAVLQAGERVIPAGRSGGATTVVFGGNTDTAFATAFMRLVREGQIQIVTA